MKWHYFVDISAIKDFLAGYSVWNVFLFFIIIQTRPVTWLLRPRPTFHLIYLFIYLLLNLLIHSGTNWCLLYSNVSFVVSLMFLSNPRDYSYILIIDELCFPNSCFIAYDYIWYTSTFGFQLYKTGKQERQEVQKHFEY